MEKVCDFFFSCTLTIRVVGLMEKSDIEVSVFVCVLRACVQEHFAFIDTPTFPLKQSVNTFFCNILTIYFF